jgi:hypothetical protein
VSAAPIDEVLARLAHVKKVGDGKYQAQCPVHESRTRSSLSIGEADDGKVLVRCWAGCETAAVIAALGLKWRDLFPARQHSRGRR